MSDIKVSVIIPVYNDEKYLSQCLDSVLNQTLKETEVICIDDGSTDSSFKILSDYASKDARITLLHQQNLYAGVARNQGLEIAQGEYLSFLDSDDFFEPDMLEKAYDKANEGNAQVVVFRSDQYLEDTGQFKKADWTVRSKALPPYRPMDRFTFTDNVFRVFNGWPWDKLFERNFVEENQLRFQEIRTSNDLVFVFMAIVLADRIEVVDDVLAHQRRNNPISLSNTRENSWGCFHTALCALKRELESRDIFWQVEQDYINYALNFSLWNYETLTGDAKKAVFQKLSDEWLEEFGVFGKPEEYFYIKSDYRKLRGLFLS